MSEFNSLPLTSGIEPSVSTSVSSPALSHPVLAPTPIPSSLPLFSGGGTESIANWLIALSDRMKIHNIPQSNWVLYASMFLSGQALEWYFETRKVVRDENTPVFSSWNDFVNKLAHSNEMKDPVWIAMQELDQLHCDHVSSFEVYVNEFRRLVNLIKFNEESTIERLKIFFFVRGLPESLKEHAQ